MTTLTANKSTAELEARDTSVDPLIFTLTSHPTAEVGDLLTISSKDGDIFIAHVEDVEEDRNRFYVELD